MDDCKNDGRSIAVLVAVAGKHGATAEIARESADVLRHELPAAGVELRDAVDVGDLGRLTERLAARAVHSPAGDFRDHDAIPAWAVEVASDLTRLQSSPARPGPERTVTAAAGRDGLYVVLGATGGIGRAVVTEALARGRRVRAVSRSAAAAADLPAGVEVLGADLSTPAGAAEAVAGATVVVHAAQPAYTRWAQEFPGLTARIADATAASGATLVFADNLYMYGPQPGGRPMAETTPPAATDRMGRVRAAMAADLLERCARGDLRVMIGRASDYYGPHGVTTTMGATFFPAALRGRTATVIGSVDAPHTMSYLPDVAAGLLTLAERDTAIGRVWHLPVAEPLSLRRFADLVAAEIDRPVHLRALAPVALRLMGLAVPMMRELAGVAYQWQHPFVVDDGAFRAAFPEAVHVTPHQEAIAATTRWWRDRALATAGT